LRLLDSREACGADAIIDRVRERAAIVAMLVVAAAIWSASAPGALADDPDIDPMDPITHRGDQYVPKPPGTKEDLIFYYGPYLVPPGWDANRVDLNLPLASGMVASVEPGMRRANDGSEPSHQEAHIHHAHWFSSNPGSETDNYTYGLHDWFFGNGDEETKADFEQRSAADPNGPIYGGHIGPDEPQTIIYMLHNKTAQPLLTYITLEVTFIHGTMEQLNALGDRPYHEVTGVLFGRTFDVPRDPKSKDGTFETPKDDPRGVIEWTSPISGTLIGTGSHLHPGGLRVITENYGPEENPCPDTGRGYGGTLLLESDAVWRKGVRFSEDFQMEVTNPAFRAPIHKGDRIRIAGVYENKRHAWYTAMTHQGFYIDEQQPPKGRCKPYLIGKAAKLGKKGKKGKKGNGRKGRKGKRIKPWKGVRNRPWGHHSTDTVCGKRYGADRCSRPEKQYEPGVETDQVSIVNFQYQPGDMALSGQAGAPVRVKQGTPLQFLNVDQAANIRHSVTTCKWPCNGPYVANYPLPDGVWDSGTLGYDVVDGGSPNPASETPPDLPVGRYSYFCRIHPWMRGAFEVVP
jgi:plastocyanin